MSSSDKIDQSVVLKQGCVDRKRQISNKETKEVVDLIVSKYIDNFFFFLHDYATNNSIFPTFLGQTLSHPEDN